MLKKSILFFNRNREVYFWILALMLLFFMNPGEFGNSLCVFKWMGFAGCPGCGIGHALHEAMHLNFTASLQAHPFGIFGLFIILFRIYKLSFTNHKKTNFHGS